MKKLGKSPSGFALIEVVVAAALGLLAVYMISSSHRNLGRVGRKVELKGELETLRQMIRSSLSCQLTTGSNGWEPYAACPAPYTAKDRNGNLLFPVEADGVTVKATSGYQIRSSCNTAAEGLVFEVKRARNGRTTKDMVTDAAEDWKNLFHNENNIGFCKEYFGKINPEYCNIDEVMVGIGPDKEPLCRSVWDRAQFQVCLQFSDHGCGAQVGQAKCTPCTSQLSPRDPGFNMSLEMAGWASDTNKYDPDCAKLIVRRCDSPTALPGGTDGAAFTPQVRVVSGTGGNTCSAICGPDEIQVGSSFSEVGTPACGPPGFTQPWCAGTVDLNLNCSVTCQTVDSLPVNRPTIIGITAPGGGGISQPIAPCVTPPPTTPPPSQPCTMPAVSTPGWVNGAVDTSTRTNCNDTCTRRITDAWNNLNSYLPTLNPPGRIRGLPRKNFTNQNGTPGWDYDTGKRAFLIVKAAAAAVGCSAFDPPSRYHEQFPD